MTANLKAGISESVPLVPLSPVKGTYLSDSKSLRLYFEYILVTISDLFS